MRYYIIGTDGTTHGEAQTKDAAIAMLADMEQSLIEEYGAEYVEQLELEIIEGS